MGFDTNRPATTAYDPKKGINQPGKDAVQVSVTPNSSATNNPYAVNVSPMANQTKNPYIKPQTPRQPLPRSAQPQQPPPSDPYGYASGPGILESWFNQRASGTDPGYEYATRRGLNDIDTRMAAGGSYNSGARAQQGSDLMANMAAQREGQLDALAAGASGEYQNRLNSAANQKLAAASGQAGTMGAYDLASANVNNSFMQAVMQMLAAKAGVDSQSNKQGLGNIIGLGSLFA